MINACVFVQLVPAMVLRHPCNHCQLGQAHAGPSLAKPSFFSRASEGVSRPEQRLQRPGRVGAAGPAQGAVWLAWGGGEQLAVRHRFTHTSPADGASHSACCLSRGLRARASLSLRTAWLARPRP